MTHGETLNHLNSEVEHDIYLHAQMTVIYCKAIMCPVRLVMQQ